LDATDVTRWAKAIKQGNTTLEHPTDCLRLKLIRQHTPKTSATNANTNTTPSQAAVHNNFNISLPELFTAGRCQYTLGSSPPTVKKPFTKGRVHESSPVLSDDEPTTEMDCYFVYLSDKFEMDVAKLTEAKTKLSNQDLDLRGIHESDVKILVEYGITYGLALKIKRCIKEFQQVSA
jgi:hypothetical protein